MQSMKIQIILHIHKLSPRAQLFKALFKGHFVNCFSGINIKYSDIFCWKKMWVAFAEQKLLTFFQQKISAYLRITQCKF